MKQILVLLSLFLTFIPGFAADYCNTALPTNPEKVNFSVSVGEMVSRAIVIEFADIETSPVVDPDDLFSSYPDPNQPVVMSYNNNRDSQNNNEYTLTIEGANSNMFSAQVTTWHPLTKTYTIKITYAPTSIGNHQAILRFDCNDGTASVDLSGKATIFPINSSNDDINNRWNGVKLFDGIELPNEFKIFSTVTTLGEETDINSWILPVSGEILDIIKELLKDPPSVGWDIDSDEFDTFFSTTRTVGETYSKSFNIWGNNTRYHHDIIIELDDPDHVFSINNRQKTYEGNHYLHIDGEDIDTKILRNPQKITLTYKPNSSGTHRATLKVSASFLGFYINRSYTFTCNAVKRTITTSVDELSLRASVGKKETKKIKVTGSNLTGPLTVKLSDSSGKFSIDKTSISTAQAADGAWISVTYSPQEAYYQIADFAKIIISGGGALSKTVHLSGLTPYLDLDPNSYNFGNTLVGESKSQNISISGLNLNGPLAVQLKDETGMFSVDPSDISLPYTENMNEIGRHITVTYNPTATGTHCACVTVVGGGAESNTVYFTGTCFERYITVTPTSLDCGTVAKGKTATKTFTVKGYNLTGDLKVSSNNSKFTVNPTSITKANATNGVTVTVTYNPSTTGSHSGIITVSGGGASNKTVSVSGKCVIPNITVTPTSFAFGHVINGNTLTKTFKVSGTDLTGHLTVKSNNSKFSISPATISKADALNGIYVNVTYKPSARGNDSGTITVSGGDASSKTVSVSGTCLTPSITVNPTSLSFDSIVKGQSKNKTFTVTGIDLTGSLTVSSSNSNFTVSPTTITAAQAAAGATVTVTYKPTAEGSQSATITVKGGDAASKTVSVTGTGVVPEIKVSTTSLLFAGYLDVRTLKVTGTNLTGSLTLVTNNEYFTVSPTTITAAQAAAGYTVNVKCIASIHVQHATGTITISGGGAAAKTVKLTYDATGNVPYAPVVEPDDEQENEVKTGEFGVAAVAFGSSTTDMNELSMSSKIYADGQSIVIESPVEQDAMICDMAGRARSVSLQTGHNEVPVNASGIYVVRIREKTTKLVIK